MLNGAQESAFQAKKRQGNSDAGGQVYSLAYQLFGSQGTSSVEAAGT